MMRKKMATKTKKRFNKTLYAIIVILAVVLGVYFIRYYLETVNNSSLTQQNPQSKTYSSKILKFEVEVPAGFKVENKDTTINLIDSRGEISIGRIATNYEDVEGYVMDLETKNRIKVEDKIKTNMNSYSILKGTISNNGDIEKNYFIYPDKWFVYTVSTSSPELYEDLDKVAQSFKYLP